MNEHFEASSDTISISESSEDIHPNIDEKSYKEWKRQMRKQEKSKNKQRLNILNQKHELTKDEKEEKDFLTKTLQPKYKIKKEDSFRTSCENKISESKEDDNDDDVNLFIEFLHNDSVDNLIYLLDRYNPNIDRLEDFVLYNLSEHIKVENDDIGIVLSRLSLLLGYFKNTGRSSLQKLSYELEMPEKEKKFNEDVLIYYNESKSAILNLRAEE